MNIHEKWERKKELQNEIDILNQPVKERWKKLITDSSFFIDWYIDEGNVCISYVWRGETDSDEIPIRFFEYENEEDAVVEYKQYLEEQRQKQVKKDRERQEANERKEYQRLKEKFEVKDG